MRICKSHDEWLKERGHRIGGSDAASILGLNPWMSNRTLWEIKTGAIQQEDISNQPAVKYGTEAETYLRSLFKLDFPEYKLKYRKNNLWTNDRYPFAHASLDGWLVDQDGRKGIWECKTTNILQSMQREKWKDRIPDNYYCQILHYLMVTEFDFAILKAQLKSEFGGNIYLQTKHYKIERAEVEDDIEELARAESNFWDMIQNGREPALTLPNI
jgi:putative phage-type endonuclease